MTPVVEIRSLSKRFGKTTALDGLDLVVEAGQVHGFLGPNGAGKTTTLRILLGMLRADSGSASVLGLDPHSDLRALHSRIAYVPGDVTLWPNLTGGEVIDVLARLHGGGTDRGPWLERFGLDPTKKCRTYSKGNRQKVALVAAFAADAELLILDEPTSGLDPLIERAFTGAVRDARAAGKTVLLSSHMLSEVEQLCDWVSIIRDGRLVDSAPLAGLRGAHHSEVTAELDSVPPIELTGVEVLETIGTTVRLRVEPGSLNALLALLTTAGVRSIQSAPPSLEDVFLAHYATPEAKK
ncbi:MAG TPA: ABC transporter ATP-binding protein [Propionicimonas sp.]|jgi:ABC-2 type transport system ATP-binding protein